MLWRSQQCAGPHERAKCPFPRPCYVRGSQVGILAWLSTRSLERKNAAKAGDFSHKSEGRLSAVSCRRYAFVRSFIFSQAETRPDSTADGRDCSMLLDSRTRMSAFTPEERRSSNTRRSNVPPENETPDNAASPRANQGALRATHQRWCFGVPSPVHRHAGSSASLRRATPRHSGGPFFAVGSEYWSNEFVQLARE